VIPMAADAVEQEPLSNRYVHMKNHHQGMFIATKDLLKAWKRRRNCNFDQVRQRPGMKNRPSQPTEGTQRVWMSSQMLYGKRHCNVQQLLPMDTFGTLTVLHLPNKNYRRIGKKGRLGGFNSTIKNRYADGTEQFEQTSPLLLPAMTLHLELRKRWPPNPQFPYRGIEMIDEVNGDRSELLETRIQEYKAYVARGGIMSDEDMAKATLVR